MHFMGTLLRQDGSGMIKRGLAAIFASGNNKLIRHYIVKHAL